MQVIDFADTSDWIDCGEFWLSRHEQGSDKWHYFRTLLLTASKFHRCRNTVPWSKVAEIVAELRQAYYGPEAITDGNIGVNLATGNKQQVSQVPATKPVMTEQAKANIARGVWGEDVSRQWYMQQYQVNILQVGIAVPKWCRMIGASADGIVIKCRDHKRSVESQKLCIFCRVDKIVPVVESIPSPTTVAFTQAILNNNDTISAQKVPQANSNEITFAQLLAAQKQGLIELGLVEFKWPQGAIYPPLLHQLERPAPGFKHIKAEHFDQMQGCMAVLNLPWCDYVVTSLQDKNCYLERISWQLEHFCELYAILQEILAQIR